MTTKELGDISDGRDVEPNLRTIRSQLPCPAKSVFLRVFLDLG